ncbi:primosomal protein [Luteimicrobium sp. NPDC057192]|uniref:primosomal protein n=1 Tax=Luteimicrobium sp. NPDC057192 TaxID=3346042 RepID=UPI00362AFCD0
MTADPRAALDRLVAALEAHYNAIAARRRDDDPAVDDAYDVLADAFEVYDEAVLQSFGEVLPFALVEDDDEDEDDDDHHDDHDFDDEDEDDHDFEEPAFRAD